MPKLPADGSTWAKDAEGERAWRALQWFLFPVWLPEISPFLTWDTNKSSTWMKLPGSHKIRQKKILISFEIKSANYSKEEKKNLGQVISFFKKIIGQAPCAYLSSAWPVFPSHYCYGVNSKRRDHCMSYLRTFYWRPHSCVAVIIKVGSDV